MVKVEADWEKAREIYPGGGWGGWGGRNLGLHIRCVDFHKFIEEMFFDGYKGFQNNNFWGVVALYMRIDTIIRKEWRGRGGQ